MASRGRQVVREFSGQIGGPEQIGPLGSSCLVTVGGDGVTKTDASTVEDQFEAPEVVEYGGWVEEKLISPV